jgi:hypothetical protein
LIESGASHGGAKNPGPNDAWLDAIIKAADNEILTAISSNLNLDAGLAQIIGKPPHLEVPMSEAAATGAVSLSSFLTTSTDCPGDDAENTRHGDEERGGTSLARNALPCPKILKIAMVIAAAVMAVFVGLRLGTGTGSRSDTQQHRIASSPGHGSTSGASCPPSNLYNSIPTAITQAGAGPAILHNSIPTAITQAGAGPARFPAYVGVVFLPNQAPLTPRTDVGAKQTLDQLARELNSTYPSATAEIDAAMMGGGDCYDTAVSRAGEQAVADYLKEHGVSASRLSMGEDPRFPKGIAVLVALDGGITRR